MYYTLDFTYMLCGNTVYLRKFTLRHMPGKPQCVLVSIGSSGLRCAVEVARFTPSSLQ